MLLVNVLPYSCWGVVSVARGGPLGCGRRGGVFASISRDDLAMSGVARLALRGLPTSTSSCGRVPSGGPPVIGLLPSSSHASFLRSLSGHRTGLVTPVPPPAVQGRSQRLVVTTAVPAVRGRPAGRPAGRPLTPSLPSPPEGSSALRGRIVASRSVSREFMRSVARRTRCVTQRRCSAARLAACPPGGRSQGVAVCTRERHRLERSVSSRNCTIFIQCANHMMNIIIISILLIIINKTSLSSVYGVL